MSSAAPAPKRKAAVPEKGNPTPLKIIALFLSFIEAVLLGVAYQTTGPAQMVLIALAGVLLLAFFAMLFLKPQALYSPGEFGSMDPREYAEAMRGKPLDKMVVKTQDLNNEVEVFGKPDHFQLLFKAKGSTWAKSTKAMEVPGGCIVQVSTEQMNLDGSWSVAEAVTFVPGVGVIKEAVGNGAHLGLPAPSANGEKS